MSTCLWRPFLGSQFHKKTMSNSRNKPRDTFIPLGVDDGTIEYHNTSSNPRLVMLGQASNVMKDDIAMEFMLRRPQASDRSVGSQETSVVVPMGCGSQPQVSPHDGDMTMKVSTYGRRVIVRGVVKRVLFRLVKFFNRDVHGQFDLQPASVCGLIIRHANIPPAEATALWWAQTRKLIVQTHTNHRNNVIKTMRLRFRGEYPAQKLKLC
jgi:hypothetical protein